MPAATGWPGCSAGSARNDNPPMAKLVLSTEGAIVWQGFIDHERLEIGRDPENAIAIDDPAVSRRHAAIVPVGNDHILDDLGSANGTIATAHPHTPFLHMRILTFGAHSLLIAIKAASEIDSSNDLIRDRTERRRCIEANSAGLMRRRPASRDGFTGE